jgi:hypothetical protein
MQRKVQPELLDSLSPQHPDAKHSRRDLRLINRIMGNYRWFEHTLPPLLHECEHVLELGAGTGELGLRLAALGVNLDGLDFCPAPDGWSVAGKWHQGDLLSFGPYDRFPVIIGNLIFHQFSNTDLTRLGETLRRTARLIVACEPVRERSAQTLFATVAPFLGANRVTRHDARVSIAAGFQGDELPHLLGFDDETWDYRCHTTALGAYRMVAIRRT